MMKPTEQNEKMTNTVVGNYKKLEEGIVGGYKKLETGVVEGYKKLETGVVEGFGKVADKCVEKLFTKEGESVEEAKERLQEGKVWSKRER